VAACKLGNLRRVWGRVRGLVLDLISLCPHAGHGPHPHHVPLLVWGITCFSFREIELFPIIYSKSR
jgi:hypothetical protein